MKKIIVIIAAIVMTFSRTAYGAPADLDAVIPETVDVNDAVSDDNQTVAYDGVCLDISTNKDGFYNLMSDVEIHYYDGEIGYISIKNPALLAFQVSSAYKGGLWMMDLEEGQTVVDELSEVAASLRAAGEYGLAEKIEESLHILSDNGPFTQAST